MTEKFLGIDLGTSSVKVLTTDKNGNIEKYGYRYDEISPDGWKNGLINALKQLDTSEVVAIGLSSQVGTYIINGTDIISWNDKYGKEELANLKNNYSKEIFIKEISMNHPEIISYPLPRLMHIKNKFRDIKSICQPKDFICELLTGNCVTDKYSWRGLANNENGRYSDYFLNELEISSSILPHITQYSEKIGETSTEFSKLCGLKPNIAVYVGMNDFYCSLLGMGIINEGDIFDITGTSEHIGIIEKSLKSDTKMVSSPYFDNFVHYGVTASSGTSMDFGLKNFGFENVIPQINIDNAPVFLPYLNGERAPVFDSDARGVFFGINSDCTKEELAYSVLEGNVFSLYHIYESMGKPHGKKIIVGGGASKDKTLNLMKAEMFNLTVSALTEKDTSALGAALMAGVGANYFTDFNEATKNLCKISEQFEPNLMIRSKLLKRYEIYKNLYPSLKDNFKKYMEELK